jgi:hypothetical protein
MSWREPACCFGLSANENADRLFLCAKGSLIARATTDETNLLLSAEGRLRALAAMT